MAIDIIFILVTIIGFVNGFSRGVVKALFYTVSIFLGVFVAVKFSPAVKSLVVQFLGVTNGMVFLLIIILLFLVTMLGIRYLSRKIEEGLRKIKLNSINRIVGGVVLASIGLLLYSSVLWFLNEASLISEESKYESNSYEYLAVLPEQFAIYVKKASPTFKSFWDMIKQVFRESANAL